MSCIITYKGQKYSEEQFKEYFNSNKQEFVSSIAKNKNVIDSFKRKMKGVDYVFSQSPELASIGSKAQYLQYLSTIFKTSKVRDIVYHGGKTNKDSFKRFVDKTKYKDRNPNSILGFFFSSSRNTVASQYAEKDYDAIQEQLTGDAETDAFIRRSAPLKKGSVSEELINIKNPYIIQAEEWENETWVDKLNILTDKDKEDDWASDYKWTVDAYEKVKNHLQSLGYDGLYINSNKELFNKTGIVDYITVQKVVFEPKQIHVLGSKQDIDGFKEFVSNKSIESKEGNTNSNYKWARYSNNSYEVSSQGDKRFSALFAKLQPGANITITREFPDGTYSLENVKLKAPLTIEEIYQIYIKGYKTVQEGKGKPPKYDISKEESYNLYKNLWKVYLEQNPELEQDLREKAKGKVLTDKFASTDVSQARALAELLNERSLDTFNTTTNNPSEFINHSGGAIGSDTAWDEIGREFGMVNNKHYWTLEKTPNGNTELFPDKRDVVLKVQNRFTVKPIQAIDKKAVIKASVATQFIGFGEGIAGSSTALYAKQISEQSNNITPKANIPQNLVSGVESFGTKQEANNKAKELLGDTPHSIDMIEAGIRTRTTRSVKEMQKYNVKVGDIVKQFGKSADGTTKNILTRVTAIHPKGTPGFFGTWEKEGWTTDGVKAIERFKDGAAAIEFEVIKSDIVNSGNYSSNDVIFVSIGGKRGNEQIRKEQQDRTIKEALKAIEAGATLITDNKSYVESSTYNEGEKRLAKNLEYKGYNYSEQTVDGQVLGIWKKEQERANVSDDTIDRHAESYKQMLEDIKNEPITEYKELDSKHDIEEFKKFVEKDKIDKPITEQENTKALLSEAISERKDSICDSQLCRTLIDTLSKNIFVNGEKIERIITPQTPITPMSRVLPILESMLRQANATFTNSLEVLKSSISSMYMGRALSNEEALTNDPTFFELANFFYINDVGPDTEVDETISIKNIARNNIEKIQDKETEEAVYGLNNISDKEELLNRLPSLITGSLEIGDLITNKQALELCPELKNLTIEINPNITESIIIKKTKIGSIPILSLRRLSDSTGTIDENVGQKVENAIALFVQAKCGFLNGVTSLNYKNNFTQLKDLNSLILSKLNLLESITEEQRETEKFKAIQYEINMLNDTMYQLLMGLYKINDENPFNSKETVEILPISRKLSEAAMKSSAYSGARLNHDGSVNLNSEQARTVMQSLGIYPVTEKNKLCRIP